MVFFWCLPLPIFLQRIVSSHTSPHISSPPPPSQRTSRARARARMLTWPPGSANASFKRVRSNWLHPWLAAFITCLYTSGIQREESKVGDKEVGSEGDQLRASVRASPCRHQTAHPVWRAYHAPSFWTYVHLKVPTPYCPTLPAQQEQTKPKNSLISAPFYI